MTTQQACCYHTLTVHHLDGDLANCTSDNRSAEPLVFWHRTGPHGTCPVPCPGRVRPGQDQDDKYRVQCPGTKGSRRSLVTALTDGSTARNLPPARREQVPRSHR
jgi:hypothetical protein